MARFDAYRNANKATRDDFPYLLDVQADLFEQLHTRLVVPLMKRSAVGATLSRLNPVLNVEGKTVVMITTDLAGVPLTALGSRVASLAGEAATIIGAIDFLLTGA